MRRVTGLGGVFFKANDPQKLYEWYDRHLGIKKGDYGVSFLWRESNDPKKTGMTLWTLFPKESKYFDPSRAGFMLNYRVENLDGLLEALRQEGVEIDPKREDADYGRFAWIIDPEGNRIELWEPPAPAKPKKTAAKSRPKAAKKRKKTVTSSKLQATRKSKKKKKH